MKNRMLQKKLHFTDFSVETISISNNNESLQDELNETVSAAPSICYQMKIIHVKINAIYIPVSSDLNDSYYKQKVNILHKAHLIPSFHSTST